MKWVVYILKCGDGSLYTGMTNDLDKRLAAHQSGTGAKYTRGRGPFALLYSESHATKSAAASREWQIKQMPRAHKQALCQGLPFEKT